MKEKLIIRNFGPIKDVELEFEKFTVLIGEQATGKSTIARLLNFCRYFSNIEGGYFDEVKQENKNHGIDEIEERLSKWGLAEYVNNDCIVQYECKHYHFSFSKNKYDTGVFNPGTNTFLNTTEYVLRSTIKPLTNEFKKLLDNFFSLENSGKLTYEFFENFVAEIMDNPFFVPTERGLQSIFSLGKDSTSNMADPLFRYYVEMEKIVRNFKSETDILPLNIKFVFSDGKSQIKKNDESGYFSLVNAASGYQSTIPIVLLTKYYTEERKKAKTFIIEEPELNLFPTAQKELVNYLVESSVGFGHSILLTTHSPYVLTSLNNLMYAYEVGAKEPEEVNKIIPRKYWINPEDVSTYRLMTDGTAKKIISKTEDGTLIEAEEIDGVSSIINKEFDELIRVDMINEEKK